ncbi:hypothetical protein CYLTODRAFT_478598 [Cylindrobasidium torrendii FP15055 ss-10]|uniref:Uncharacterized protein n=1 Tax=Cylindrobasidium torrendii FP15055 ss-10 TaxID=1314674 RepID=A0A0D7ATA4_9AGAR|nr:hypothetical protein CYLTODRAFT_478598 [Cylindrobasidium torrendii FP15055 ss-10]
MGCVAASCALCGDASIPFARTIDLELLLASLFMFLHATRAALSRNPAPTSVVLTKPTKGSLVRRVVNPRLEENPVAFRTHHPSPNTHSPAPLALPAPSMARGRLREYRDEIQRTQRDDTALPARCRSDWRQRRAERRVRRCDTRERAMLELERALTEIGEAETTARLYANI